MVDENPGDLPSAAPQTPRRHRWIGALVATALAVVVAGGFGAVALLRNGVTPTQPSQGHAQEATSTPGADWKVYRDPLELFTMRLPPGWTETVSTGTYTQSSPQGSDSGQTETITFRDPSLGDASASISVDVMPIHDTPIAKQFGCGWRANEHSMFHGYAANTFQPAVVLFESGDAHFQINETIPGVLEPVHSTPLGSPPPPTAPPAATVTADRSLLDTALNSFQPTDPNPLVCP